MEKIEIKEDNQLLIFYPDQKDLITCDLIFNEKYDKLILLIQVNQINNINTIHSYLIYEDQQKQFLYSEYNEPNSLSFSTHRQPIQDIYSDLESLPHGIGEQIVKVFHFLKIKKDIHAISFKNNPKIKT